MNDRKPGTAQQQMHICICIPTFRRPERVQALLVELLEQKTDGRFDLSILVVDDDKNESARTAVDRVRATTSLQIRYVVAGMKNVAAARNVAAKNATGDFIAFMDDDEIPVRDWLLRLFDAYYAYEADGVLGPVKPIFDPAPPEWILKGRLFDRPSWPTGMMMHWDLTRTGNVLLRRSIFDDDSNLFDLSFTHGEDKDFFRRMIGKGLRFVWCEEGTIYEKETPDRFTRTYFLKRALLRGSVSMRHRGFSLRAASKAVVAVTAYTVMLPLLLVRQHLFMAYLIKACDHLGALMAACRVDVAKYCDGV